MSKMSKAKKERINKVWDLFYLGYPSYKIAKELNLSEAEVIKILYPNK